MKAARWVGLGRVECEDVPVPPAADGEVLVRTVYASICGSDLHEVFFETPPPSMPAGHPGHEVLVGRHPAVGAEPRSDERRPVERVVDRLAQARIREERPRRVQCDVAERHRRVDEARLQPARPGQGRHRQVHGGQVQGRRH